MVSIPTWKMVLPVAQRLRALGPFQRIARKYGDVVNVCYTDLAPLRVETVTALYSRN